MIDIQMVRPLLNLTLTSVVFECKKWYDWLPVFFYLTLTSVVFELNRHIAQSTVVTFNFNKCCI